MSSAHASDDADTFTVPARSPDEPTIDVRIDSFCFCGARKDGAAVPVDLDLLRACEPVWRQLAPSARAGTEAYLQALSHVLSTEPLHLITASAAIAAASTATSAFSAAPRRILGLALMRSHANTFNIQKSTLDCIVVDSAWRSRGLGRGMVNAAKELAGRAGSSQLTAVVPTLAADAARFLLKEKIIIRGMGFSGPTRLKPDAAAASAAAATSLAAASAPAAAPPAPAAFRTVLLSSLSAPSAADLLILRAAEPVHRQLRDTQIAPGFDAYAQRMRCIGEGGGRMVVVLASEPAVAAAAEPATAVSTALGVGVYRFYTDAVSLHTRCYVDDLVTDSSRRSIGVGAALVAAIRAEAAARGVESFQLDSGVQRTQAHKFYFREGLVIESFACAGPLTKLKLPQ